MDAVKGSGTHHGKRPDKRAERSRRTREKIIAAARDLFIAQGYGATSLQEVADRAGVAVQTVYFVFRNKRALFKDVVDTSIAGDTEPVATMERDWFRAACAEPTAAGQLRAHVQGVRAIQERVAPVIPLIAAAAPPTRRSPRSGPPARRTRATPSSTPRRRHSPPSPTPAPVSTPPAPPTCSTGCSARSCT